MKLRNIIIALSAVIAFTGCSNDNDAPNPYANAKAKLTIKASSKTVTKADTNELPGEANLNTLTTLVFNEDGTALIGAKTETLTNVSHSYTMTEVPVMEPGRVKLVMIANAPANAFANVTTFAEAQAILVDLSTQSQTNLTMSTPVITTTASLAEGVNYIGVDGQTNVDGINTLYLTRVPARLQVEKVSTNFTKETLVNRQVLVKDMYFENVKTKSYAFSVADWGKVMADGNYASLQSFAVNQTINNSTAIANAGYVMYAMENLGPTQTTTLVVSATLVASGDYPAIDGTFRAIINANGTTRGFDHNFVKRNYVYGITLTFGNNSFDPQLPPPPTPTTGTLDVKVTVVGWGDVSQNPVVGDDE